MKSIPNLEKLWQNKISIHLSKIPKKYKKKKLIWFLSYIVLLISTHHTTWFIFLGWYIFLLFFQEFASIIRSEQRFEILAKSRERGYIFKVYHLLLTFIWNILYWMLNVPIFHFLDLDGRIWNLIYPKICKEDQTICILMLSVFRLKPQVWLWNLYPDL